MPSEQSDEWVTVARLGRTRGLRGELTAVGLSNRPGRYDELNRVFLFDAAGRPLRDGAPFEVERVWTHQGRLVFKFRGLDSINDAEPLEQAEVRIPLAERPPLPDGEYYQSDIVGCEVIERGTGKSVGRVAAWLEYGPTPLLQVVAEPGQGESEILIPFARSIFVEIDLEGRRLVADLPEGLKDLNASSPG